MISIFDAIRHKYPNIQGVVYWYSQYDGSPWEDPYDGLVWDNTDIEKPTKDEIEQWRNNPVFIKRQLFEENKIFNSKLHTQLDTLETEITRQTREGGSTVVLQSQYSNIIAQLLPTDDA